MSASIDQQFVEFIVKSLVGNPDAVKIERRIDEKGVLLELTVDPEDLGRVIGKRGATAQSLRTLLRALGTKNDARYNLKIIDNGEPRPRYDDNQSSQQHDEPAASQNDDVPVSDSQSDDQPPTSTTPPSNNEDTSTWSSAPATDDNNNDDMSSDETDHTSIADKTRKELEDLDDLDV